METIKHKTSKQAILHVPRDVFKVAAFGEHLGDAQWVELLLNETSRARGDGRDGLGVGEGFFFVDKRAGLRADHIGVVTDRNNGNGSSGAGERVAKSVGESVQVVGLELVVVDEHNVVRRAGGADETSVRLKVEVVGEGVGDNFVDDKSGREVAGSIGVLTSLGEQTCIVLLERASIERKT
jgi:hypothetical protein